MSSLESPRLRLRRLTHQDAAFILQLLNDPDFHAHIGDKGVRTLEDARVHLDNGPLASYARHGFGLYLIENKSDRAPVGICGLIRRETLDDVDLGYALLPEYRGAGIAEEACRRTLVHAGEDFNLQRIVAIVSPGNAASTRLLETLGFKYERRGQVGDDPDELCVYGIELRP